MEANVSAAFSELERKGYAVENYDWQSGEFQVLCDGADSRKGVGDYWQRGNTKNNKVDDFGINKKVAKILDKYGLYAEWINAEICAVHKSEPSGFDKIDHLEKQMLLNQQMDNT